MNIEYEAMFENVAKDKIRKRLQQLGAKLIKPEFKQIRNAFFLPVGHEIEGGWLRVRDESDKVTMSLKVIDGDRIEDQKEICVTVDSYSKAMLLLQKLGCRSKGMQENFRELWRHKGVEITIDHWPFIEPFVEVESGSEATVKMVSEELGFNWSDAIFGPVGVLVQRKYGVPLDYINNYAPDITFDGENPWLEWEIQNRT